MTKLCIFGGTTIFSYAFWYLGDLLGFSFFGSFLLSGVGSVVGVCSTGDVADPGANIHAGSNYAILSQAASFIRNTAGV